MPEAIDRSSFKMRRVARSGMRGAVVLGLALLPGSAPVEAAPRETAADGYDLSLRYEAYYSGFHVASGRAHIQRDPQSYSVVGSAEARGIFDWLTGWRGQASSTGQVETDDILLPERHRSSGVWRGNERSTELAFRPDGTVGVRVEETDEEDDPDELTPIPDGMTDGTLDPISVVLSLSQTLASGGVCQGDFPIFDGRRRYNVTVRPEGSHTFNASGYSVFSGEAVGCRLSMERIGGFRKSPSFQTEAEDGEEPRERIVWVGRPSPDFPPVPVRVEVETRSGKILLHLTEASLGGETISLYEDDE